MKSVICPYCQTELIGSFQPGDAITCAACKGRFQPPPAILKENSVSNQVCPFCGTSFESKGSEGDFIQCPSCEGRFTKPSTVQKASVARPDDVRRATWLLAASVTTGSILSVLLFFAARKNGDWDLLNAVVKGSVGSLPFELLFILFVWKAFKGRDWPRRLFNVLIPLGILFSGLTLLARHAADRIVQTSANGELEWLRWVSLSIIVLLDIGALYCLNSSESRTWLRSPQSKKIIADRPWWIAVLAFVILCPCLMFFVAHSQKMPLMATSGSPSAQEQRVVSVPQAGRNYSSQPRPERTLSVPTNPPRCSSPPSPASSHVQELPRNDTGLAETVPPRIDTQVEPPPQLIVQTPAGSEPAEGLRTEIVDGIPWTFVVENGSAIIQAPAIPKEVSGSITIPASLGGFPVVEIAPRAFFGHRNLRHITVPGSVREIGKFAFGLCHELQSVILENGVSRLESDAFAECESLQSITFPASLVEIGDGAFYDCVSLSRIVLPESLRLIGDGAFDNCASLSGIVLPESIRSIGSHPFRRCSHLSSIQLASSDLFYVSQNGVLFDKTRNRLICFPSNNQISEYSVPEGVLEIDEGAFDGCKTIETIHLPSSLKIIHSFAFGGCQRLKYILIPSSVKSIGSNPFQGCSSLSAISVSSDNSTFFSREGALYNRKARSLISYPIGKKDHQFSIVTGTCRIGDRAFYGSEHLTTISIPDSVKTIGDIPFYGCNRLGNLRFLGDCPEHLPISFPFVVGFGPDNEELPITIDVSRHSTGWDTGLSPKEKKFVSIRYFD